MNTIRAVNIHTFNCLTKFSPSWHFRQSITVRFFAHFTFIIISVIKNFVAHFNTVIYFYNIFFYFSCFLIFTLQCSFETILPSRVPGTLKNLPCLSLPVFCVQRFRRTDTNINFFLCNGITRLVT